MPKRPLVMLLAAIPGLWGCASDPAPQAVRAPVEPVIVVGPPAMAPDTATMPSDAQPGDQPGGSVTPTDRARADGRPAWWIDEPQTASGRVYLSVEALGIDVRSARRAAVDSGIDQLTRMIGHDPLDDRVHATTVRPLPHRGGSSEGMRYIGYVLVSAEAPGAG
jgi:hypothetical protein